MQVVDSEGYLKVKLVGGPVGPFVPYTGATANVDLGEYEIKVDQLTLDTSPTGTAAVGTTRWNDSIGSSETTLKGGSVILKNGVDLVARVVNKVTPNTTLTKANYPAVRVSGAQGQRLAIAYAQANNDNNSADTIGLVIETIATNQEGFIMTVGQLEGINTTGSLQGETWVDGDVLYLSPTTPGALTNIKPTGLTGHIVVMGYVEYAHAVNGKIYVKIMNGWELDELHNVYINPATLANNNILQYDSTDQLWKNQVLSTGLTVGTTPIASGTIGRVLFQGTGNVVQESANLFWDNTNGRLGIGTSSPATGTSLDVNGRIKANIISADAVNNTLNTVTLLQFSATGNRLFDNSGTQVVNVRGGNIQIGTTTDAGFRLDVNGTARVSSTLYFTNGNTQIFQNSNDLYFAVGSGINRLVIKSTGNILIGTTTDAGFKLDVNGTARVQTSLMVGSQSAMSSGVKLETDGVARVWTRLDLGQFGATSLTSSQLQYNISGSNGYLITNATSHTATTGTYYAVRLQNNIAPTSGTGVFNLLDIVSTINQTGGANGITRGLYINPTLTSAFDFRAIETARGNVVFGNLPTSSAGLPTGAIWNDGGTLKIV